MIMTKAYETEEKELFYNYLNSNYYLIQQRLILMEIILLILRALNLLSVQIVISIVAIVILLIMGKNYIQTI